VIPWTRKRVRINRRCSHSSRKPRSGSISSWAICATADRELEELSTERRQHELLGAACGALERALADRGRRAVLGRTLRGERRRRADPERARPRRGLPEAAVRDRGAPAGSARRGDCARRRTPTGSRANVHEAQEEAERRAEEWTVVREIRRAPAARRDIAVGARRRGRRALPQVGRHRARDQPPARDRDSAGRAAGVRAGRGARAAGPRRAPDGGRSGRCAASARTGAARAGGEADRRGAGAAATKPKVGRARARAKAPRKVRARGCSRSRSSSLGSR